MICTSHQILFGYQIKKNEMGKKIGVTRILVGRPEGRKPPGRPRLKLEDNIKMDIARRRMGTRTGLIWLRVGTCDGFLECGNELFGFHKMRRIS
jgi:hypothetical protein